MAVTIVMFPKVIAVYSEGQKIRSLFLVWLVVSLFVSLSGVGFLAIFFHPLVEILWGSVYDLDYKVSMLYCFAMVFLNINNLHMQVNIAAENSAVIFLIIVLIFLIGFGLIYLFASSPLSISGSILLLNIIAASIMTVVSIPILVPSEKFKR